MAGATEQLNIQVTADNKAGKAFGDLTGSVNGFVGKIKSMGPAGIAAGAAIAGVGAAAAGAVVALKAGVEKASEFESTMSNIATLISGDSTEAIEGLSDGILELTRNVPKDANELGAAAYDIVSAGVQGTAQQLGVLEASSKLAVAGLGDTSGAVDLMTSSINAFGLDAENSANISDVLFKTVKNGKTTVDQLRQGFGGVAPAAAAAGVKMEELMAATSAMTTTGLPAAEAYTQLKSTFKELNKPGTALKDALDSVGISNAKAAIESEGFDSVLGKLLDSVEGDTIALQNMFGSAEAGAAAISLTSTVSDAYTSTLDDMKNGANAVDEAFGKQNATFESTKQRLKNLMDEGLIRLGEKVLPFVNQALDFLMETTKKAKNQWDNYEGAVGLLRKGFNLIGDFINEKLKPAFQELMVALEPHLPAFKAVAKFLGGAFLVAVGAVILAIGEIILIATKVITKIFEFQTAMQDAMSRITDSVSGSIGFIVDVFSGLSTSITDTINGLIDSAYEWGTHLWDNFKNGLWAGFDGVKSAIDSSIGWIRDKVGFSKNKFLPTEVWGQHMMENFSDGMVRGMNQVMGSMNGMVGTLNGQMTGDQFGVGSQAMALSPTGASPVTNSTVNNSADKNITFNVTMESGESADEVLQKMNILAKQV